MKKLQIFVCMLATLSFGSVCVYASEEENRAATKIQANFRGFSSRKAATRPENDAILETVLIQQPLLKFTAPENNLGQNSTWTEVDSRPATPLVTNSPKTTSRELVKKYVEQTASKEQQQASTHSVTPEPTFIPDEDATSTPPSSPRSTNEWNSNFSNSSTTTVSGAVSWFMSHTNAPDKYTGDSATWHPNTGRDADDDAAWAAADAALTADYEWAKNHITPFLSTLGHQSDLMKLRNSQEDAINEFGHDITSTIKLNIRSTSSLSELSAYVDNLKN
jgi:IQ calmodulin-binding motif